MSCAREFKSLWSLLVPVLSMPTHSLRAKNKRGNFWDVNLTVFYRFPHGQLRTFGVENYFLMPLKSKKYYLPKRFD